MQTLGRTDVIEAETSFETQNARPTLPGERRSYELVASRPRPSARANRVSTGSVETQLAYSLSVARLGVERVRTSSTLAALAQLLEATGANEEAVASAREALDLCVANQGGVAHDPIAAQISLAVLVRLQEVDRALEYVQLLPSAGYANLMLGSVLASLDRFDEARRLIDKADLGAKGGVLAYLQMQEGNDQAAIPLLRRVLRNDPDDADSAYNLSIALWRIGSRRKAMSAALQASRSGPGRQDLLLHYLELLLSSGEYAKSEREVARVLEQGVQPTARLLIIQARAKLGADDFPGAERLLSKAGNIASAEGDGEVVAEVRSNLIRLRAAHGKLSTKDAIFQLLRLHEEYRSSNVVVASLAQVTRVKSHASVLEKAFAVVVDTTPAARAAFIRYQIATLKGDNATAANQAKLWFELEPESAQAASAAMVALGIGAERWDEALLIATHPAGDNLTNWGRVNNAAYILAMCGRADEAIAMLEPKVQGEVKEERSDSYILMATLGLAYLASGKIDQGMRLYRRAADLADEKSEGARSLMTAFQALVVRQLKLLSTNDPGMISAVSLPPVELPDDWDQRPEFLRLKYLAEEKRYGWPLSV